MTENIPAVCIVTFKCDWDVMAAGVFCVTPFVKYFGKKILEKVTVQLLFRQSLAFTAKDVRKRSITKPKSICEANLRWILACYWNGVNSNTVQP